MQDVLVGYDGSEPANRALRWAVREAEVRGVGVTVVQSWTDAVAGAGWIDQLGDPRGAEMRAKVELDDAVAAVAADHPSVRVDGRVVSETPRDALIGAADEAAMVVIGARGRGGFARLLLGSVSESVAGHAPITAVVVRGETERSGPVVAGIDGSDSSRSALRWAAEAARVRGETLRVVLAWSYLDPKGEHGAEPFRPDYTGDDATAALERIVADELGAEPGVEVRTSAINGLAAATVLEVAEEASLIAVGAHGRSGRIGTALGSTTRQILHHAPCPVAVVRDRGDS